MSDPDALKKGPEGDPENDAYDDYSTATMKISMPSSDENSMRNVEEVMDLKGTNLIKPDIPQLEPYDDEEEWDQYTILGILSRNDMVTFLVAKNKNTHGFVVLKVLNFQPGIEKEQMQKFLEDAQILAQLEHHSIIPIYEIGLDLQGQIYIAMPYIESRKLSIFLEQYNKKSYFSLVLLFRELCQAVQCAHSANIIHRNLHPENIIVNRFDTPIITGWSCCHFENHSTKLFDYNANVGIHKNKGIKTIYGRIVGNLNYMAPESIQEKIKYMDIRSDIYALGAIFYNIITGYLPHHASETKKIIHNICNNELIFPARGRCSKIPSKIKRIITKAMNKKKVDRYQSIEELIKDIDLLLMKGPSKIRSW